MLTLSPSRCCFLSISVHARSPGIHPSDGEPCQVHSLCHLQSDTLTDCRFPCCPRMHSSGFLWLYICLERKTKIFPNLMFYFPISLLDLNLAYLNLANLNFLWHALHEFLFWTRHAKFNLVFLGKIIKRLF